MAHQQTPQGATTPTVAQRIFPVADWAPVQEAILDDESPRSATEDPYTHSRSMSTRQDSAFPNPASNENRLRSMSLSLPWRSRPKSFLWNHKTEHDDDDDTTSRFGELDMHDTDGTHGGASKPEKGKRSVFRRASTHLKGFVHRRTSVPAAIPEFRLGPARPTTAHSTWHRLRQAASFRHSRAYDDYDSVPLPVPGNHFGPPIIPENTGAAAKAAAKAANVINNECYGFEKQRKRLGLSPDDNYSQNDRESGIGITLAPSESGIDAGADLSVDDEAEDSTISRIDFISRLPVELAIQVLAHLDAKGIAMATSVSRHWRTIGANQHIWRESFLREKTGTYATSDPVKPGTGLGVPAVHPDNDWKEIYRAKKQLDWRWEKGKAEPVYLNGHSDSIYCLQFDETKIVTGSRDKTIRIWDMHTYECKLVMGPPEVVNDMTLLLDGSGQPVHHAVLGNNMRAAESMPACVSFPIHHKASILCLQYDDRILVTGSSDSSCIVHSVRGGWRPIRRLRHHAAAVLDLCFDDRYIVTCSKDISICVWDRESGQLLKQLRGHQGPVNAVQMRGNTIVSCSGDFRVKLWNIDTGKNIREFAGHTKGLACSQFSEDGRYIASAGNDKVIRIWDANTGECLRQMKAHDNLVRSLHIDSVSGRLISGSYDTDIKVFNMETGDELLNFPRWHASWVLSAKSDYRRVISTGQDPKILIMDFGLGVKGIEMLESEKAIGESFSRIGAGYI